MQAERDAVNQRRHAHSASINLEQQSWHSVIFAGHFVFHAKRHKQSARLPGPHLVYLQQVEHPQQSMAA